MARKLLLVDIDTSKVSPEKLTEWVVLLLTLELPGNPVRSVEGVRTYVVLPSEVPSLEEDEITPPDKSESEVV